MNTPVGRAALRGVIHDWIAPPNVTGIYAVHRSIPKLVQGQEYSLPTEQGSGAIAMVYIKEEREKRIAFGGNVNGIKQVDYDVAIVLRFRSVKPDMEVAMDDYDATLEALKERIRADHTFGNSGVVFEAGESGTGLTIVSDLPVDVRGETHIWSAVEFTVVQMIQA